MPQRKSYRSDEDVATGVAAVFVAIWFMAVLFGLAFWGAVIYLLIKLAGSL